MILQDGRFVKNNYNSFSFFLLVIYLLDGVEFESAKAAADFLNMNEFSIRWILHGTYRDWETDRKSTRLNSSHSAKSRMPSSA